jgi:hypothetical protein
MTGIQPSALLHDEQLYAAAVEQAELAEWSTLHELLARNIEASDHAMRQAMANAGFKSDKIPKPVRIRRPGQPAEEAEDAIVMRPHEFAKLLATGGKP